jgi:diacylglycerol kinase (ATP)
MVAKVILNPYANRWKAQALWTKVHTELNLAGVEFELAVSERRGQLTEIACESARQGFSPILIAGGDGTIGEVVNGLAKASPSSETGIGPIGIIPLGTANDFAHNLGLPLDIPGAVQRIKAAEIKPIDLCQVNEHVFVNNAALGLEPTVTLIQQEMVWAKGTLRYMLAALQGIMRKPMWQASLEWEGGSYSGPISLVTVGNGAVTGGIFYMTPHANPADGNLTFVHAFRKGRLELFRILPRAMKAGEGSYVELEGVYEIHSPWLKVHLETPSPAHADGEIFSLAIQDLEYKVLPGRMQLLC